MGAEETGVELTCELMADETADEDKLLTSLDTVEETLCLSLAAKVETGILFVNGD